MCVCVRAPFFFVFLLVSWFLGVARRVSLGGHSCGLKAMSQFLRERAVLPSITRIFSVVNRPRVFFFFFLF